MDTHKNEHKVIQKATDKDAYRNEHNNTYSDAYRNDHNNTHSDAYTEEHLIVLASRNAELEQLIAEKQRALAAAPEGHLRIQDRKTYAEYYRRTDPGDTNGKFIPKKDWSIARKLAQKDYDRQILSLATKELALLIKYLDFADKNRLSSIYDRLNIRKKELVIPYRIPDEEYLKQWLQPQYEAPGFEEDSPEHYTGNGIRVRSKSEIIIANLLDKFNIPFKYECPLALGKKGVVHPDFTCLNVRTRKEYIWEHFGMMDNEDYARKNIQKINTYEENGYFEGNNLIMTFETSVTPINSSIIKNKIRSYLM